MLEIIIGVLCVYSFIMTISFWDEKQTVKRLRKGWRKSEKRENKLRKELDELKNTPTEKAYEVWAEGRLYLISAYDWYTNLTEELFFKDKDGNVIARFPKYTSFEIKK
jgi:predicted nucleotide-binding protein (sugar kinase/HSP70/actin superfamily)